MGTFSLLFRLYFNSFNQNLSMAHVKLKNTIFPFKVLSFSYRYLIHPLKTPQTIVYPAGMFAPRGSQSGLDPVWSLWEMVPPRLRIGVWQRSGDHWGLHLPSLHWHLNPPHCDLIQWFGGYTTPYSEIPVTHNCSITLDSSVSAL